MGAALLLSEPNSSTQCKEIWITGSGMRVAGDEISRITHPGTRIAVMRRATPALPSMDFSTRILIRLFHTLRRIVSLSNTHVFMHLQSYDF